MASLIRTIVVSVAISMLCQSGFAQEDRNRGALEFIDFFKDQKLKKDEFETTTEHQNRTSAFTGKEFVLALPATSSPFGVKPFSYDSDSKKLTVRLVGHGVIPVSVLLIVDLMRLEASARKACWCLASRNF